MVSSQLSGSLSPAKRRHDLLVDPNENSSPRTSKRARKLSKSQPDLAQPVDEHVIHGDAMGELSNVDGVQESLGSSSSTVEASFSTMDAASHDHRLAAQEALKDQRGTDSYSRHVKSYSEFMVADQARLSQEIPGWVSVPAFPITARNVAAYLKVETTRLKKRSDGTLIPGTRLSVHAIKQCVSALEYWRSNHEHLYPGNADALRSLRDDSRIRAFETNAQATESERNAEAQVAKAKGTTADTFTRAEAIRASMWCMEAKGSKKKVHLFLRDRAMLLFSTSIAFRGDNTRSLLLSDLSSQEVPLIDAGLDVFAFALVCFSDEGKTNTTGRIDEQAAFRHRFPELCPIGALGFYLFSHFHILGREHPDFAPDYSKGGELGDRSWYRHLLFPGSGNVESEMTYDNHRKRTAHILFMNDIHSRKVTHIGRPFAATHARQHGASVDGTKALGNWRQGQGAYRACYDRTLPKDAMLAVAEFNGNKQETFHLPRDSLTPPPSLVNKIFPWIETVEEEYQQRRKDIGINASDVALFRFLLLLKSLRGIILQDAAVLRAQYPNCPIFNYFPFNAPEFITFAEQAPSILDNAEREAKAQLQALPETMAASLRGILAHHNVEQARLRDDLREENARFREENARVSAQLQALDVFVRGQSGPKSRKQKVPSTEQVQPKSMASQDYSPPSMPCIPVIAPSAPTSQPSTSLCQDTEELVNNDVLSLSGNTYPYATFPLSTDTFVRNKQLAHIAKLEKEYSRDCLAQHQFEWIRSTLESQEDEWLPIYLYWRPKDKFLSPSVREIWDEYTHGINGKFSIMQLTNTWGARWRRNNSATKTEASRRKKITTLIETLQDRHSWTAEDVLGFLEKSYSIPTPSVTHLKTTRAFIDCLQKKDGVLYREVLEKAKQSVLSSS